MCDMQEGQWRLDSKNECVNTSEPLGWAILVVVVDDMSISFSASVVEAMIATCEC